MSPELKALLLDVNQQGLSVFPLKKLNAVSIYTTDFYENYDYDVVLPGQRSKLVNTLAGNGFKQSSGRIIKNKDQSIIFEFPKPNFTLGDDPADKAEKLINNSKHIIILTPTQALLIYLKRYYDEIFLQLNSENDNAMIEEITTLLYEQPANLDKVREWLGPSNQTELFILLKPQLRDAQKSGITHRRQYSFKSKIAAWINGM